MIRRQFWTHHECQVNAESETVARRHFAGNASLNNPTSRIKPPLISSEMARSGHSKYNLQA